jgi:FkbM family methyltransferase
MGKFEKTGVRTVGLKAIELINWIRLYGIKDGISLFTSLLTGKKSMRYVKASFLKTPIILRNNKSDKPIFFQVFYENQYGPYGVEFPKAKRIIDAGANIGCASIYFSLHFPEAEILAIEPEQNNFSLLQKNTSAYKNVSCIQAGIWNKNEDIIISNPNAEAAEFMIESGHPSIHSTVKGITIEKLIEINNWDTIDILKLDIEGAEKEIFSEDNFDWLKKVKLLIIELHDRYKPGCTKAVFRVLNHFNYDAYFHHENIFIFFK